uniref:Uncharacterized protein n=1 Tax=Solanum lycopersicum TaxID=4081 RepID=A0A3Q7GF36_SOLLC
MHSHYEKRVIVVVHAMNMVLILKDFLGLMICVCPVESGNQSNISGFMNSILSMWSSNK